MLPLSLPSGAWKVYRFSQGISEADTWNQDGGAGPPATSTARRTWRQLPRPTAAWKTPTRRANVFNKAALAIKAVEALGEKIELMDEMMDREARLKTSKSGRLAVEIDKEKDDRAMEMPGWIDKKDKWVRIFEVKTTAAQSDELGFSKYDNLMRELVAASKEGVGWVLFKDGEWIREPAGNIKMLLQSKGLGKPEAEAMMGEAIGKSWTLVDLPFKEEYPGGPQWNMDAAQLRYEPAILSDEECPSHSNWDKILNHIGQDLNAGLRDAPWAQKAGIKTGAQHPWLGSPA